MAAYRRVYDSRHLHADCQEPGSAPEPYARQSSMGYLYLLVRTQRKRECVYAERKGSNGPPPTVAFFIPRTDSTDSPNCLPILILII